MFKRLVLLTGLLLVLFAFVMPVPTMAQEDTWTEGVRALMETPDGLP